MGYLIRGARMVFFDPSLRSCVWRPMLLSAAVLVALVLLGSFAIVPWLGGLLESWGVASGAALGLSVGLYFALWVWLGGIVYIAIAGVLSSFLWDRLSEAVEGAQGPVPARVPLSVGMLVRDTMGRAAFSTAIAIAALLTGWICVPLAVVLAGWLSLYDYTSCAYLRRGVLFGPQTGRVFDRPGWLGFAIASGLVSLIPLANLLLLPAMVAGGTLLVRAERS